MGFMTLVKWMNTAVLVLLIRALRCIYTVGMIRREAFGSYLMRPSFLFISVQKMEKFEHHAS
jgi:hypothetical protein